MALGLRPSQFGARLPVAYLVIGGGVAQVGEAFLAQVRAAIAEFAMPEFARTPLLPAALGADSGLVGAAVQVWET